MADGLNNLFGGLGLLGNPLLTGLVTGLVDQGPLRRLTPLYLLILLGIAVYWLSRIWREARQGRLPRVSWWALPGWLALLFTPVLELPALFGLGGAALLLAEYWPGAYRLSKRKRQPSRAARSVVLATAGVLLGLSWLVSALWPVPPLLPQALLSLAAALALLLGSLAWLVSLLGWGELGRGGLGRGEWGRSRQTTVTEAPAPRSGFAVRWSGAVSPVWPELSVSLNGQGAELHNISSLPLNLAGWSPAGLNAWFLVRDAQGRPLKTLHAGQSVFLPLPNTAAGVRVWYTDPEANPKVFSANWTPTVRQSQRVLN